MTRDPAGTIIAKGDGGYDSARDRDRRLGWWELPGSGGLPVSHQLSTALNASVDAGRTKYTVGRSAHARFGAIAFWSGSRWNSRYQDRIAGSLRSHRRVRNRLQLPRELTILARSWEYRLHVISSSALTMLDDARSPLRLQAAKTRLLQGGLLQLVSSPDPRRRIGFER